jgi:hypothetical protein
MSKLDVMLAKLLVKIPSAESNKLLENVVGLDTLRGRLATLDHCIYTVSRVAEGAEVARGDIKVWQIACGGKPLDELLAERKRVEEEIRRRIEEAKKIAERYGATQELNTLINYLLSLYPAQQVQVQAVQKQVQQQQVAQVATAVKPTATATQTAQQQQQTEVQQQVQVQQIQLPQYVFTFTAPQQQQQFVMPKTVPVTKKPILVKG